MCVVAAFTLHFNMRDGNPLFILKGETSSVIYLSESSQCECYFWSCQPVYLKWLRYELIISCFMLITQGPFCSSCCQTLTSRTLGHLAVLQAQLMDGHLELIIILDNSRLLLDFVYILTGEGWNETIGDNHTGSSTISILLVKITQCRNNTLRIWCACTIERFIWIYLCYSSCILWYQTWFTATTVVEVRKPFKCSYKHFLVEETLLNATCITNIPSVSNSWRSK